MIESTHGPRTLQGLVFSVVLLSGMAVATLSQVSAVDYTLFFWRTLPLALIHLAAATLYFVRIHDWTRWVSFAIGSIVLLGYLEFAVRALLSNI